MSVRFLYAPDGKVILAFALRIRDPIHTPVAMPGSGQQGLPAGPAAEGDVVLVIDAAYEPPCVAAGAADPGVVLAADVGGLFLCGDRNSGHFQWLSGTLCKPDTGSRLLGVGQGSSVARGKTGLGPRDYYNNSETGIVMRFTAGPLANSHLNHDGERTPH